MYAKKKSGCTSTAKAYEFMAEPGYLHDIKGEYNFINNMLYRYPCTTHLSYWKTNGKNQLTNFRNKYKHHSNEMLNAISFHFSALLHVFIFHLKGRGF